MKSRRYLNWRKSLQLLAENLYVTSRGRYCPRHPDITYLSSEAANLSLPGSTYGLDVLVRIAYLRDYYQMSFAKIKEALPSHIEVSERHLRNLYRQYQALLACADRLEVEKLKAAASKYGGLILSVDGLKPEGGQQALWVVREVLTGTLLAAGWLPRDDEKRLVEFLKPVKALDLPFLATVSDKQASLINALEAVFTEIPHQYCQAHYFSNAVAPLYDADQHMKTQMRKQIRKVAGPTMREVLARNKEKKDDDGVPGLIVTGLAVQPPVGLHEVKAAAQATIKSPTPCDESISCQQNTSNEQTIIDTSPVEPQINPILPATCPSPSTRPSIPDAPLNEIIPPATKKIAPSIAQPSESQIAQPFFGHEAAISRQIVPDSDTSESKNNAEVTCKQTEINISTQEGQGVSEDSAPSSDVCNMMATPPQPNANQSPSQIIDDYRTIAQGMGILIYQRKGASQTVAESGTLKKASALACRQQLIDEIVCDYANRLQRVLSRNGRKPFRLAGLRLYADLLALLASLEISLSHLTNEPSLTCFADGIREALKIYKDEYISIAEGYSWLLDISKILDVPEPSPEAKLPETLLSETVQAELNVYLQQLSNHTNLSVLLLSFRKHLLALTNRYSKGIFYCYDIAGLPRTNNDIESLFGRVRRQTLLTSGQHHAKHRLHEQGAWLLFEIVTSEHEQLKRLERVSLEDWQKEWQRMLAHQATFTANRSFRRNPKKYLAELEARAAEVARLPSEG